MKRFSRTNQPKTKKHTRRSLKTWQKILLGIVAFFCLCLLAGVGLFAYYANSAPKLSEKRLDATASSKLYALNGDLFEDLGAEKREKATKDTIPQSLKDAIVSVEDQRFYKHDGIDPVRIASSALHNVSSGGLQGGSTLTQQLIKLSFFSTKSADRNIKRKAQEAWLALKLEKKKSKQEILTYYINKVYMANGMYGMQTAAKTYFGKPLAELNLAQTALLAGMPQAPNSYDPYLHPKEAKERRDIVLYTMLDNQKISQKEYDAAVKVPVQTDLQPLHTENRDRKVVDNYVKEVIHEVQAKTGKNVYTDGLDIYTNLDLAAQKRLYEIVNTNQYVQYPDQDLQVAATLMDVGNGKVTAQIGGRNVPDDVYLGNNLAVNTHRDFGSTVKPITDYGPAFEFLKKSTGTMIKDEPYKYQHTDTEVKNWDNRFMGNITLRKALYESRNVPAVKLYNEVGPERVSEFLKRLGIEYKQIEQSNAISSNTNEQSGTKYGISSEKMAAAYSAIANGGTYFAPQYVNKVRYQDGTEQSFEPSGQKAMEPGTAYMLTDVLKDVISQGTGTNAQIPNLFQAGKTGTSNYTDDELKKIDSTEADLAPDVMFSGFTTLKSLSIWTGYNDRMRPMSAKSNMIASDVYRQMMAYLAENLPNNDWQLPEDLVRVGNELYFKDAPQDNAAPQVPAQTQPKTNNYNHYNNYNNGGTSSVSPSYQAPASSASQSYNQTPQSSAPTTPNYNGTGGGNTTNNNGNNNYVPPTNNGGTGNNSGNNNGGGAVTPPAGNNNNGNAGNNPGGNGAGGTGGGGTPPAGNGGTGGNGNGGGNTGGGAVTPPAGNGGGQQPAQ
ncbi:PBP1A family penicillin-binding protein [Enterococcus sp. CSURQ0835]|uniref:PBP1A family penicillin-binding protein n=1 Tax=Enterococcus sp. CSURQ0835 TaxID=2681394 RepID=UPI00190F8123